MRTAVSLIIKATETSINILLVIFMVIFVCAAFAYVYWAETLQYRCMNVEVGEILALTHHYNCK